MKTTGGSTAAKRRAGERAAREVEDGFVVGLGTGSTTAFAIEAIGRAVADGLDVRGIPTSFQSRQLALEVGISLTSLDAVSTVDLAIDGADAVVDGAGGDADGTGDDGGGAGAVVDGVDDATDGEPNDGAGANPDFDGTLIKGGGAAHTREKVVASASDRFVVVVDPSKLTPRLERSVPVEVLPEAHTVVSEAVRSLGGEPTLRDATQKDGPVVTDNGNLVLDCDFGQIDDPRRLASSLSEIPGALEHGLFVDRTDAVYVGHEGGAEVRRY